MSCCLKLVLIIIFYLNTNGDNEYSEIEKRCIDVSDNIIFNGKTESKFQQLFDIDGNTKGMMFVYIKKMIYHSQNIFHQFAKYLSHFHDIISLVVILQYYRIAIISYH